MIRREFFKALTAVIAFPIVNKVIEIPEKEKSLMWRAPDLDGDKLKYRWKDTFTHREYGMGIQIDKAELNSPLYKRLKQLHKAISKNTINSFTKGE